MKQALTFLLTLTAGNLFAQLTIISVNPDQADPGTTGQLVTFTIPDTTPPSPPVQVVPTSVTIGTLVGTSLARVSMDTVTALFSIPGNEPEGAKDCAITFPGPQGDVIMTKTAGFTVGEASTGDGSLTNGPPSSGYNLFGAINSTNTYLMDNDENMVKTWSSSYPPGNSVYLLEDGTLMRTANTGSSDFNAGGAGGRVERFDWDGSLIWATDYDTTTHRQHHDVEVLPNGHMLMIAWELKTEAEALAAGRNPGLLSDGELWPDSIIEVAPTGSYGGTIVWEWHAWDHLVQDYSSLQANFGTVADHPEKINLNYTQSGPNAGSADWLHINSIDYNEELDQILLSVHNHNEIWVIDHNTTTTEAAGSAGDLLYRWGNPAAYDSGDASDQQLFVQHDAKWIEVGLPGAGHMLIFNNGEGRSDGDYSSVDEIIPPVAPDGTYATGLPLAPTWSYSNAVATNFFASRISGAQRLPNGHTLICEGTENYAFEVTPAGGLVWDYTEISQMFRFERYPPDYAGFTGTELELSSRPYTVVDTVQTEFYDDSTIISEPGTTDAFYGQDASHVGHPPTYEISPDGLTVLDYNTGLVWQQSPERTGDSTIDTNDKITWADIPAYVASLNGANFGGHDDWRLPTIKELYSLVDFRGTDPSGYSGTDTSGLIPYIDPAYFDFGFGDTGAGERVIDAQYWSGNEYVSTTMNNDPTVFGFNFADGRIKGYPRDTGPGGSANTMYLRLVRGNTRYGINQFADHGNLTVSDYATGLMWSRADSGSGMNWQQALAWVQTKNTENHLGYADWRLPNAKELQTIFDYTRSPATHGTAAIDPVFSCTPITAEDGSSDFPFYWTGTTHATWNGNGGWGVYHCFGTAFGYVGSSWIDVHGAGAQRSDPKYDDGTDYSTGHGPQGDCIRIDNFVRLVRDVTDPVDSDGDGLSDEDEVNIYGTDAEDPDSDDDGMNDGDEVFTGTDPNNPGSYFALTFDGSTLRWPYADGLRYELEGCTNLVVGSWFTIGSTTSSNYTHMSEYEVLTYRVMATENN